MSARSADALAARAEAALDIAAETMGVRWVVDWFFTWLVDRYPALRDWKLTINLIFWRKSVTVDDVRRALIAFLAEKGAA